MSIQEYAIKGEAFYLSKVFSSDFQYSIPDYQRPYSWEEEHIKQLFDDLYEFYQRNTDETYFLGSIVVIKKDNQPNADVVDGQQRLTSLTILFAVLASFLEEKYAKSIEPYLQQPENLAESIMAQPRLVLRKRDKDFFRTYIQELQLDKLKLLTADHDCKTDAQKHIYKNTLALVERVTTSFFNQEEIFNFFKFLIQKCCLVIVSTPNQKSAFRIFSVMNNRGLDLLPTDILKADMIGKIQTNQDEYTDKWEDLEQALGRNRFNELFTYIRMIELKNKAQKSILEEFQELVLPKIDSIPNFIDNELSNYANAFLALKNNNYQTNDYKEEITQYIKWLNRVPFSEWLPVAILFMYQNHTNEEARNFFKNLEILTSYLHLSAKDVNKRIERYALVLQELQGNPKIYEGISLFLNENEKVSFKALLDGNIYKEMTSVRRNYLILRLDEMVSDGAAKYSHKSDLLTIEHILPQTIKPNSQWREWWNDEQHSLWLHRLANLVPLNKSRNSAASNWDFNDKKTKYFFGTHNVSSYALTSQVLNTDKWKPDNVQQRQEELLNKICEIWQL